MPTEEVAFYYNKIAFMHQDNSHDDAMNWDQEKNRPWPGGVDWLFDFGTR